MNLRPKRRERADINLTPLIDVVFLLLIFFMVSTTFKDDARLRVQLPEARGEPAPAAESGMVRVLIDAEGYFRVDDLAVVDRRPETLRVALQGAAAALEAPAVLIQADARTPHQAVMTVLDAAARAGLARVAFAATQPQEARE